MSHIASINFVQLSDECQVVCDRLNEMLKRVESAIADIENVAMSDDAFAEANAFTTKVKAQLFEWRGSMNDIMETAYKWAQSRGIGREEKIGEASALRRQATNLSAIVSAESTRLMVSIEAVGRNMSEMKVRKILADVDAKRNATKIFIENMEDPMLRQFAKIVVAGNDRRMSQDDILTEAKSLMQSTIQDVAKEKLASESHRLSVEMKTCGIAPEKIETVVAFQPSENAVADLIRIESDATQAIVDEGVRRKTLIIIKKAIEARGFIVDKSNIRKQDDMVTMLATKLSGERARFKVYLDGKFVYDFSEGYKGQACEQDIAPFERDLEEIYGGAIVHKTIDWSNPDKISSHKMQVKGKNYQKK